MTATRLADEPRSYPTQIIGALRLVLRLAAVLGLLVLCMILSGLNRAWRRPHNPWPRRFLAGSAWLMGIAIRTCGNRAAGRLLVLANHVSWIDILAIAAPTGSAFVGHDGLATMPLLRWLCAQNDTVFVARHDRASVARQVEQLRTALVEMGTVTLFPEGTTSDGLGLLAFKSSLLGALDPLPEAVTVQPVFLDYGPDVPELAWIGTEHGLTNFRRILSRAKPTEVTVRFLPPLSGEQLTNRKTIAAAARAAIAGAMIAR